MCVARTRIMNVALLVLDTVRKDYFDEYAQQLRQNADVEFEKCYTPSTWTASAHASMATGTLPHTHRVDAYSGDMRHLQGETFLSDISAESICVSTNINLNIRGFADFFDTARAPLFQASAFVDSDLHIMDFLKRYDGDHTYLAYISEAFRRRTLARSLLNGGVQKAYDITGQLPPLKRRVDYGTKRGIAAAKDALPNDDFFLFVNLMEAHAPHQPTIDYDPDLIKNVPNSWTSRHTPFSDINRDYESYGEHLSHFRDVYGASIEYLDRKVSEFVEFLVERDTMVIVTSDHGENLGYPAESAVGHQVAKGSDSLAHVPLLVFNPPSEIDAGLTSLINVGDLVTGGLDGSVPDITRERVGVERVGAGEPEDTLDRWKGPKRVVYENDCRWIWDTEQALREELPIDLYEEEQGTPTERPHNSIFECTIEEYLQSAQSDSEKLVTDDVKHRLEQLGYA